MTTTLYTQSTGTAPFSPTITAGAWERDCSGVLVSLCDTTKANTALSTLSAAFGATSSSQTRYGVFVSPPLDEPQTIGGTCSIVIGKCGEGTLNDDGHLAFVLRVVGPTGTHLATLVSQMASATEFPLVASAATRIFSALSVTSYAAPAGSRLVLEVGVHGVTPASGATFQLRFGDPTGTGDFALTNGLTTDLVPWCQLSQTLTFGSPVVPVGDGTDTTDVVPLGLGGLVPTGEGTSTGEATLSAVSASGDLVPTGEGTSTGEAVPGGLGALLAAGDGQGSAEATPAGAGALELEGLGSSTGEGVPLGLGALLAAGEGTGSAEATPAGAGALELAGEGTSTGEGTLSSVAPGDLVAAGEGTGTADVVPGGLGALLAAGEGQDSAEATPAGAGALELAGEGWSTGDAVLQSVAPGDLAAAGEGTSTGEATPAGTGALELEGLGSSDGQAGLVDGAPGVLEGSSMGLASCSASIEGLGSIAGETTGSCLTGYFPWRGRTELSTALRGSQRPLPRGTLDPIPSTQARLATTLSTPP